MSLSRVQKLGIAARVAGRLSSRYAGQNRWLRAGLRGLKVTAASFRRVLGILWLEVTGFVFLTLAAIGGLAFTREYAKFEAGKAGSGRALLAVCFTLVFAWFGVTSFWRARRRD
ncbi:MAG: hypothetical protein JO249_14555 [Acidobacteria bacterium]|nr:hypothetical protein [Acidobacteriota bacterium]MBV9481956.1 hypothetical protein [Acidobacteriota bacterium]